MIPKKYVSPFEYAERDFNEMLFRCSVPYEATRTTENVKMYGTYQSGNSFVDSDTNNRPTTVYMSCSRLLKLYRDGVQIRVLEYEDTKKIYNVLQTYLLAWKDKLKASFNIRLDDPDFFIKMDELAAAVYDHAVPLFANDEVRNLFLARSKNITKFSGTNFFKEKVVNEIENKTGSRISRDGNDYVVRGRGSRNDDDEEVDPRRSRQSMSEHFKEILAARKGYNQ